MHGDAGVGQERAEHAECKPTEQHADQLDVEEMLADGRQFLRVGDAQGQVPFAIPEIDYRRRLTDPVLGGRVQLQFNSLAISRTSGGTGF